MMKTRSFADMSVQKFVNSSTGAPATEDPTEDPPRPLAPRYQLGSCQGPAPSSEQPRGPRPPGPAGPAPSKRGHPIRAPSAVSGRRPVMELLSVLLLVGGAVIRAARHEDHLAASTRSHCAQRESADSARRPTAGSHWQPRSRRGCWARQGPRGSAGAGRRQRSLTRPQAACCAQSPPILRVRDTKEPVQRDPQ